MRIFLILTFLTFSALAGPQFFGEKRSLVKWKGMDHKAWFDYELWKDHRAIKDEHPRWRYNLAETRLRETMGRVIQCVGECRIYRGEGYSRASFRSSVKEGDEVVTSGESYIWIFLYDGTLVRMSPGSSVSFKELNIGEQSNFLLARINSGNVFWLSRDVEEIKESDQRETDSLFLPLAFGRANPIPAPTSDDDLYSYLQSGEQEILNQYRRLNTLIVKNNKFIKNKKSRHFLVMPNGTLWGDGVRAEFIVLTGKESYFKNRSFKYLNDEVDKPERELNFFFRGYANKKNMPVLNDVWYKVAHRGREVEEYAGREFGIGEYLTKRITSLQVARELMLNRYASFVFDEKLGAEGLAKKHGYRLWSEEEFDRRVAFLKEYTRREETTNLLVATQFKERLEKSGEQMHGMNYSSDIYRRAIHNYSIKRETGRHAGSEKEMLNSTRRRLWNEIK